MSEKTAVILASELTQQLINGNKRFVKETLRALPKGTGLATVFFMRSNFQGIPDGVRRLRLILTDLAAEEE